jgi:hypothetical protein
MENPYIENILIEQEKYYVLLLIDCSQSMLFPYLEKPESCRDSNCDDYRQAFTKAQDEMIEAHRKALVALRNSLMCREGYLYVYQYAFNHKRKVLNPPAELSSVRKDNVVEISRANYKPDGMTALYDVISEALNVIYDQYLLQALNEDKRADKVIIGVITDGDETCLKDDEKKNKRKEIEELLTKLRNNKTGRERYKHLESSVLIGLTSNSFTSKRLRELKEELTFDEYISISQSDEKAIRAAFRIFSTDAANR